MGLGPQIFGKINRYDIILVSCDATWSTQLLLDKTRNNESHSEKPLYHPVGAKKILSTRPKVQFIFRRQRRRLTKSVTERKSEGRKGPLGATKNGHSNRAERQSSDGRSSSFAAPFVSSFGSQSAKIEIEGGSADDDSGPQLRLETWL